MFLRRLKPPPAAAAPRKALPALERILLVQRLIERIDYDGAAGQLSVTFHARAIHSLSPRC
jgi:hypothetical protein